MTTITHIKEQLTWIADHDYAEYDSPISQSRGSVAVYKADINRLLDLVEEAFPTEAAMDGIDTDDMQIALEEASTMFSSSVLSLQAIVGIEIIDKIRHRITRIK